MQHFSSKFVIYSILFSSLLLVIALVVIFYNNSLSTRMNLIAEKGNVTSSDSSGNSYVLSVSDLSNISYSNIPKEDKNNDGNFNMLFTGDNMLGQSIAKRIESGEDPYEGVKEFLQSFNLVYANLETSMGEKNEGIAQKGKSYTFKTPLKSMDVLKDANISILGLANNHINDYGSDLILKMMERLKENSFTYFGVGKDIEEAFGPKYLEYEGTTISFLGFNGIEGKYNNVSSKDAGAAYFDDERIIKALKEARLNSDIVIVFPHFGTEISKKSNDSQQKYSRLFIDNGADLVIGMHSHVIQDVEKYKDKYIYYSIGNFVFEADKVTDTGLNVGITIKDKKITEIKEYEVKIKNTFPDSVTFRKTISL